MTYLIDAELLPVLDAANRSNLNSKFLIGWHFLYGVKVKKDLELALKSFSEIVHNPERAEELQDDLMFSDAAFFIGLYNYLMDDMEYAGKWFSAATFEAINAMPYVNFENTFFKDAAHYFEKRDFFYYLEKTEQFETIEILNKFLAPVKSATILTFKKPPVKP